jgi:Domain of unknown function (DUF5063)
MDPLVYKARLRLLKTEEGGRQRPIQSGYRPDWDLGTTWLGQPSMTGGKVTLEGVQELAPGDEADVLLTPRAEEGWCGAELGAEISMHEGSRVVGYATLTGVAWMPWYYTTEVSTFAHQARQFVAFVESAHQLPLERRLLDGATRLQELYAAGLNLPHIDPDDHEEGVSCYVCDPDQPDELAIGDEAANGGARPASSTGDPSSWPGFGEHEMEAEAESDSDSDPDPESDPSTRRLSDLFLDIYRCLQQGLALWDLERDRSSRPAAIWRWFSDFDGHWIDLAVDGLRRLQRANGER